MLDSESSDALNQRLVLKPALFTQKSPPFAPLLIFGLLRKLASLCCATLFSSPPPTLSVCYDDLLLFSCLSLLAILLLQF